MTPPEALALWNSALSNDPAGLAEFSGADKSGFKRLVRMGAVGFSQVVSDFEFEIALAVDSPVYIPDQSTAFCCRPTTCWALTRGPNSFSLLIPEFHRFAVQAAAYPREADIIETAYEQMASGIMGVSQIGRIVDLGTRVANVGLWFVDSLFELGQRPYFWQMRGTFGGAVANRPILIYG